MLAGGVHLVQSSHERRLDGIGDRDAVLALYVSPRQGAGELSLAGLLPRNPIFVQKESETELVLVENLVDGLGEERGGIVRIGAQGLGDGDHVDPEL